MARFRIPLLRRFADTFSGIRNHSRKGDSSGDAASGGTLPSSKSSGSRSGGGRHRKPRRLLLDSLEERQLLSLTAAGAEELLATDHLGWAYSTPTDTARLDTVTPFGTYAYSEERILGTDGRYYPKYIVVPGATVSQSDRSMAGTRDDDFAMTWTQIDTIRTASLSSEGRIVVNPDTGLPQYEIFIDQTTGFPMTDLNVYGKYFTDEVQRFTLPEELLNGSVGTGGNPSSYSTVTLQYGGNEIQKLTVTTGTVPVSSTDAYSQYGVPVKGQITLGFDLNGNGTIENSERTTIFFNEADFDNPDLTLRPEYIIQQQLSIMGGALKDVRVQAISAREFLIHFGDASQGYAQPQIQIIPETTSFTRGFLPWATVEKYNVPIEINVNIYPNDPVKTAQNIELAFKEQTQRDHVMAPWSGSVSSGQLPTSSPVVSRFADTRVQARVVTEGVPAGAFGFELTFVGAAQSQNIPQIRIVGVKTANGTKLDEKGLQQTSNAELYTVQTIKETSDVFRVNSADPIDPLTLEPRPLNQYDSQIAMDASGNFVVVWTGNVTTPGSYTDIFARQFNPTTLVNYVVNPLTGTYEVYTDSSVQGQMVTEHGRLISVYDSTTLANVQAGRREFQVNTTTNFPQARPTVGMDDAGNFTIGWQTTAQDQSWFEGMVVQRFNANAERVGGENYIEADSATYLGYGSVSMSRDGYTVVVWGTVSADIIPGVGQGGEPSSWTRMTYLRMLDQNGNWVSDTYPLVDLTNGRAAMAWDASSTLTLALARSKNSSSVGEEDFDVLFWQFDSLGNNLQAGVLANSPGYFSEISGYQSGPSIGVDADGDLFISYEGRGRNISGSMGISGSTYFAEEIAYLRSLGGAANLAVAEYLSRYMSGADLDLMLRNLSLAVYDEVAENILSKAAREAERQLRRTTLTTGESDSQWMQIRDREVARLMGFSQTNRPTMLLAPYYRFRTEDRPTGTVICNQMTLDAYRQDVWNRLVAGTWIDAYGNLVEMTPEEADVALRMYDIGTGEPLAANPDVMVAWARVDAVHYADRTADPVRKAYGDEYERWYNNLWAMYQPNVDAAVQERFDQLSADSRNSYVTNMLGLGGTPTPGNVDPIVSGTHYDFQTSDNPGGVVTYSETAMRVYRRQLYGELTGSGYRGLSDYHYGNSWLTPTQMTAAGAAIYLGLNVVGDVPDWNSPIPDDILQILAYHALGEGNLRAWESREALLQQAFTEIMGRVSDKVLFEAQVYADRWFFTHNDVQEKADALVSNAIAIMGQKLDLLRGEAYSANFSTWNASQGTGTFTLNSADNVANARRDGNNSDIYLAIPLDTGQGSFTMRFTFNSGSTMDIVIQPVYTGNPPVLNVSATRDAISSAIQALAISGGPTVRTVNQSEILGNYGTAESAGTYWDFAEMLYNFFADGRIVGQNAIYELTFIGDTHNQIINATVVANSLATAGSPVVNREPNWQVLHQADPGRPQTGVSIYVNPSGNAIMTWTETNGPTAYYGAPTSINNSSSNGWYGSPTIRISDTMWGGYYADTYARPTFTVFDQFDYENPDEYPTGYFSSDSRIWFRRFNDMHRVDGQDQLLDTAGPTVTNITAGAGKSEVGGDTVQTNETFLRELNGTWTFEDGRQGEVTVLVVSFDEDLAMSGKGSVLDPKNWSLHKDGANFDKAIYQIYFGMNKSAELSDRFNSVTGQNDLSSIGANRWEAVIILNGADTPTANFTFLPNGNYELIAKATITDVAGNRLNANGYQKDGKSWASPFQIMGWNGVQGVETVVDAWATLDERSTTPVASNAHGDYVTVFRTLPDTGSQSGIFFDLYKVDWYNAEANPKAAPERQPVIDPDTGLPEQEFYRDLVTSNPTACCASVAMDGDGDFVVVWMQNDGTAQKSDWNIYARKYDFMGRPIPISVTYDNPALPKYQYEFRVNQTSAYDQQYPSVAMDAEGSFVVTWQSWNQDGSGWGIFGQRFTATCAPIGDGQNAVQTLTFDITKGSAFRLQYGITGMDRTGLITYTNPQTPADKQAFCTTVKTELEKLWFDPELGIRVSVNVTMDSSGAILVEFTGLCGSQKVDTLVPLKSNNTLEYNIGVIQSTKGVSGEFQVNQTTESDQIHPSVTMNPNGDVVISWTSFSLDATGTAWQSDIYARRFVNNSTYLERKETAYRVAQAGMYPLVVTSDDWNNHIVYPGMGKDGVVRIVDVTQGGISGSGSLLWDGMHILTAAHVVDGILPSDLFIYFDMPEGRITIPVTEVYVHQNYAGFNPLAGGGYDIAILTLAVAAPPSAERYDIYRDSDEIGKEFTFYGYGEYGNGQVGEVSSDGYKRVGKNTFDALGPEVPNITGGRYAEDLLIFDFDDGTLARDALGQLGVKIHSGLGYGVEANTARGDSGGPSIINGKIAAVTSGGSDTRSDIDAVQNGSYGEISYNTRVSMYAGWIDSIVGGAAGGGTTNSEFIVNTYTDGDQKWSDVAIAPDGSFVVAWTSWNQEPIGSANWLYEEGYLGNGVWMRRFNADGTPVVDTNGDDTEVLVNTTVAGDQQQPRITMDAAGNFVIVWEGFQDKPEKARWTEPNAADSWGVFAQQFVSTRLLSDTTQRDILDDNGDVIGTVTSYTIQDREGKAGSEFRIGQTIDGDQRYPGVAMDREGDFVVVWSGAGEFTSQGVFYSHYIVADDHAGPIVTEVLALSQTDGIRTVTAIPEKAVLKTGPDHLGVIFSEAMVGSGEFDSLLMESVTNKSNWELIKDGRSANELIDKIIIYGRSEISNQGLMSDPDGKFEVVLSFTEPLPDGTYELVLKRTVEDIFGNPLDGRRDGIVAADFTRTFTIGELGSGSDTASEPEKETPNPNPITPDTQVAATILKQTDPIVACDADGNYVLVWVEYRPTDKTVDISTLTEIPSAVDADIVAQRFNHRGEAISQPFVVNNLTLPINFYDQNQITPDVSMDSAGNFVIVWAGWNSDDVSGSVCMRKYNSLGVPVTGIIQVNEKTEGPQVTPSVALSDNGTIVVAWGGPQFTMSGRKEVMVSDTYKIYAAVWTDSGNGPVRVPDSGDILVNVAMQYKQTRPQVAIDGNGNFVVVWESYLQAGSGTGTSIYGRWFSTSSSAVTARTGELLINQTTKNNQAKPDVAMDNAGNAVIAWQSEQNITTTGIDIYYRRFSGFGVAKSNEICVNDYVDRYNDYMEYDQYNVSVTMARTSGNFTIGWTGRGQEAPFANNGISPGIHSEGVYGRVYNSDGTPTKGSNGKEYGVFRANSWMVGNQNQQSMALSDAGRLITVWHSPQTQLDIVVPPDTVMDPDCLFSRIMKVTDSIVPPPADFDAAPLPALFRWYEDGASGVTATQGEYDADGNRVNTVYQIAGTSGADSIVITTAASLTDWVIMVNGSRVMIPQGYTSINLDTGAGSDTLRLIHLNDDAYDASLHTNQGTLSVGSQAILTWTGVTTTYYDGGRSDVVSMSGSNGSDMVTMGADGTVVMVTPTGIISVGASVGTLAVNGQGGRNTLVVEGTSETSRMAATADRVTVAADDSSSLHSFVGFVDVTLYGSGDDTLDLTGTSGVDQFLVTPTGATLIMENNARTQIHSSGFFRTQFTGGAGADQVRLIGSDEADTLSVGATNSGATINFTTGSAAYVITGAEVVRADLRGGDNIVNLTNAGARSATLIGYQDVTTWRVGDLDLAVTGGVRIAAKGTMNDQATLYDSVGNDSLTSKPGQVKLTRPDSIHKLTGFGNVTVQATAGGYDTATIMGGSGDDLFISTPESSMMKSEDYTLVVNGFGKVNAYAGAGGNNVAIISDSTRYETKNTLTVTPSSVTLSSGQRQSVTVSSFGSVQAISHGGNDEATFSTSTGNDTFGYSESLDMASLSGTYLGTHYGVTATGYTKIGAISRGGVDEAIFDLSREENLTILGKVATAITDHATVTATNFATNRTGAVAAADAIFGEAMDD